MSAPTINIPRGGNRQAEEAAAEKEARSSSSFNDWEYLSLKGADPGEVYGESVVLRMVTDEPDWLYVKQHSFIPTKKAPKDIPSERKWPARMGAVCRHTKGYDELYDECFICDHMQVEGKGKKAGTMVKPFASTRLWAVAVVRKPVIGTQKHVDAGLIEPFQVGRPFRYEDETFTKDEFKDGQPTGKTLTLKKFVVLNFASENFFDKFLGYNNTYGTVVDRDYKVTRKGSGTDTDYEIVALDVQTDDNGKRIDLRNPDFAEAYKPTFDLQDIITAQTTDEHYEWFFDNRVESSWEKRFPKKDKDAKVDTSKESSSATPEENQEAQEGNNQSTIDAMRQRLADKGKK